MNKVIYAKCKISFSDWKIWTLYEDNYLLLFKQNSLLVHNASQVSHIYSCQFDRALVTKDEIVLILKWGVEVKIQLLKTINEFSINELWVTKLKKSLESDKTKLVLDKLDSLKLILVSTEYQTNTGRIDIFCTNKEKNTYYVLELKNKSLTEKDINQCLRYIDDISTLFWTNINVVGYVFWESYSKKVEEYSKTKWIKVISYSSL